MVGMPIWVVAAVGLTLVASPVHAQPASAGAAQPFRTTNPVLRASLERISKGSPQWREAASQVAVSGRYAVILTSNQVRIAGGDARGREGFDPTFLAEAAPVVLADGQVQVVVVVINLELLEDTHWRKGSLVSEFEADLDRIVVHEVYGHAVPYLLAGSIAGRCSDPAPGERAMNACSIQRENVIRAELGLGRRTDYGLADLALLRRDRH